MRSPLGLRDLFRRSVAARYEPDVEFLGEQDGPGDTQLKALLTRIVRAYPFVTDAYLARVCLPPARTPTVAICLVVDRDNPMVERDMHAKFKILFSRGPLVDILYLSREQKADVARVCPAFYSRAS